MSSHSFNTDADVAVYRELLGSWTNPLSRLSESLAQTSLSQPTVSADSSLLSRISAEHQEPEEDQYLSHKSGPVQDRGEPGDLKTTNSWDKFKPVSTS